MAIQAINPFRKVNPKQRHELWNNYRVNPKGVNNYLGKYKKTAAGLVNPVDHHTDSPWSTATSAPSHRKAIHGMSGSLNEGSKSLPPKIAPLTIVRPTTSLPSSMKARPRPYTVS